MNFSEQDQERFIRLAMGQAEQAIDAGDEPFGVVLIGSDGDLIAGAHNTAYSANDLTAHAEINLIRQVQLQHGRNRFIGSSIFLNATSCGMCACALVRAGIRDFYYGAPFEPHTNPGISYEGLAAFCREPIQVIGGILVEECKAQIERGRRVEKKR